MAAPSAGDGAAKKAAKAPKTSKPSGDARRGKHEAGDVDGTAHVKLSNSGPNKRKQAAAAAVDGAPAAASKTAQPTGKATKKDPSAASQAPAGRSKKRGRSEGAGSVKQAPAAPEEAAANASKSSKKRRR